MKNFFKNISKEIYESPEKLASEFLYYLMHNFSQNNICDYNNANVIIVNNENSLEHVTKRCILISEQLFISNNPCLLPKKIYKDIGKNFIAYEYFSYNNNLSSLGKWIQNSKALLINGMVTYIPNGYINYYDCDAYGSYTYGGTFNEYINNVSVTNEILSSSKKIITISKNKSFNYIEPILSLNIPILDNIDMEDFSNITLENLDELQNFQTYLKYELLSIDNNNKTALEKLSLNLQLQVNDIKHKYNNTIYKYRINSAINCVATITAVLFCINPNISEVIKVAAGIGSGYGLINFLRSNQDYFALNENLKNNNCYFLWLLQPKN